MFGRFIIIAFCFNKGTHWKKETIILRRNGQKSVNETGTIFPDKLRGSSPLSCKNDSPCVAMSKVYYADNLHISGFFSLIKKRFYFLLACADLFLSERQPLFMFQMDK